MGFNSLLQYKARVLLIVEGHNMTQYKAKKRRPKTWFKQINERTKNIYGRHQLELTTSTE